MCVYVCACMCVMGLDMGMSLGGFERKGLGGCRCMCACVGVYGCWDGDEWVWRCLGVNPLVEMVLMLVGLRLGFRASGCEAGFGFVWV